MVPAYDRVAGGGEWERLYDRSVSAVVDGEGAWQVSDRCRTAERRWFSTRRCSGSTSTRSGCLWREGEEGGKDGPLTWRKRRAGDGTRGKGASRGGWVAVREDRHNSCTSRWSITGRVMGRRFDGVDGR